MRAHQLTFLLFLGVLVVTGTGCGTSGGSGEPVTDPSLSTDSTSATNSYLAPEPIPNRVPCPEWFAEPPRDTKNFYAVASEIDEDVEVAFERARQNCLSQFGETITYNFHQLVAGVKFQQRLDDNSELLLRFNQALEKAPALALESAAVTDQTRTEEGNLWRVCLLMELRRRAVDQAVYDVVVADEELHAAAREGDNFQTWEDYLQGKYDE